MAVVRIQDLATAPSALSGTEPVEIEQGGVSYKTTAQAIANLNAGLTNPMTTAGDIIRATTGGAAQRLGIGASGDVLTVVSGVPAWAAPSGGGATAWKWRGSVRAVVGSTSLTAIGVAAPNFVAGGASGPLPSLTNYFSAVPRRLLTAFSSTTAINGYRSGDGVPFYRGSTAGVGGFDISQTMGVGAGGSTASHRFFIGVRNAWTDATDVNPSTLINIIGIGYDSGDTQVQIMHNDGTGTATKVALGASFPKPVAEEVWVYNLRLTAVAGSSSVSYNVTALNTGATASGTISTDLPAATAGLSYWGYLSAGGTATAIGLAFVDVDMATG